MQQYLRKVKLTAKGAGGGLVINGTNDTGRDLKIVFDIDKSISSTQNTGTIEIWNLSESNRNAMGKELDDITLEAGYLPPQGGGNVGVIFSGQIRDVTHYKKGPDIITTLFLGDGDKAIRSAVTSKSYKAGTPVKEVVDDLSKELEKEGVSRGEQKLPENLGSFKRPYATVGSVKRELDLLSRGFNFYWSVQNGVCEIIPGDGFVGGIVLITPETGMVGTPTITDNGVKVTALLNPEVRPGRRVRIESKTLEMNAANGEYRVSQCRFSGDNREGDMIVFIHGEAVKGDKVDEGLKLDAIENYPASAAPGNIKAGPR